MFLRPKLPYCYAHFLLRVLGQYKTDFTYTGVSQVLQLYVCLCLIDGSEVPALLLFSRIFWPFQSVTCRNSHEWRQFQWDGHFETHTSWKSRVITCGSYLCVFVDSGQSTRMLVSPWLRAKWEILQEGVEGGGRVCSSRRTRSRAGLLKTDLPARLLLTVTRSKQTISDAFLTFNQTVSSSLRIRF